jgi:hypothetical protein
MYGKHLWRCSGLPPLRQVRGTQKPPAHPRRTTEGEAAYEGCGIQAGRVEEQRATLGVAPFTYRDRPD